jgi:hypothetical protein
MARRVVASYELLRTEALGMGGEARRGWGMVLLLRQGLTGWMRAFAASECLEARSSWRQPNKAVQVPVSLRAGATKILVNMSLRRQGDEP